MAQWFDADGEPIGDQPAYAGPGDDELPLPDGLTADGLTTDAAGAGYALGRAPRQAGGGLDGGDG